MIEINGNSLSFEDFISVAFGNEKVAISREGYAQLELSHKRLLGILESDRVAYGIKTGFGELCNISIKREDSFELQKNIVRSHAAGVGPALDKHIVQSWV